MTVSEKIRDDWGTIKHFCRKNDLAYQSVISTLCGRTEYITIVNKLIELEYIQSADDLKKEAA